jgi:hypothetical protein
MIGRRIILTPVTGESFVDQAWSVPIFPVLAKAAQINPSLLLYYFTVE